MGRSDVRCGVGLAAMLALGCGAPATSTGSTRATATTPTPATATATERPSGTGASGDGPCLVRGRRELVPPTDPRCVVDVRGPVPAPAGLALALAEAPATIRSGDTRTFTLELHNPTPLPIRIVLAEGCTAWEASASNATASTFESDCAGLCGTGTLTPVLDLAPGAVVTKRVTLRATRRRISGDACEERDLGPLPPGAYTLRVELPWDSDDARSGAAFEAPLTVTP